MIVSLRHGRPPRPLPLPDTGVALLLALLVAAVAAAGGGGCALRDGRTSALPTPDERAALRAGAAASRRPPRPAATEFPLAPPDPPAPDAREPALRDLRRGVAALLDAPELRGSLQAAAVLDLERDEWLILENADVSLRPASALKLLTTAALLDHFGPEHTLETPLVLAGDAEWLVVGAVGDPSISGRYDPAGQSTEAKLDVWAQAVAAAGVASLGGGIVVDDHAFSHAGPSPWWELEDLGAPYAAPLSAFAVHENCVDVRVVPGAAAGEAARVVLAPPNKMVAVVGRVETIASGESSVRVARAPGGNVLTVSGRVAVGAEPHETWRAVDDGNLWSADLLEQALARRGVTCGRRPRLASLLPADEARRLAAAPRRTLHVHVSRPLFELVTIINKPSQNFYADMLLAVLARATQGDDAPEARDQAVRAFLRRVGVDDAGLAVADGSGLSWRNLATARQLAGVLRVMARHPDATAYYNSLPIAGLDGTMARRLADGPAAGNVRAKTGYIHRTRAMAGYVTCADGRRVAFALLANNYMVPTSRINALHDAIVEVLAAWEREAP